jgi:hypothetical protein
MGDPYHVIATVGIIAGLFGAPAIWFYDRIEPRHVVYLAIFAAALLVFSVVVIGSWNSKERPLGAVATFLGALLAAAGWVISNEVSTLNSRKQHTIKFITDYLTNSQRISDKQVIDTKIPYPTKLTPTLVGYTNSADPFIQALDRELNFFEFMTIAILRGDMSEALARRMMADFLIAYYEQCDDYITYWQARKANTWAGLTALYRKWEALPAEARAP